MHLATWVLLLIAAGVLVRANMKPSYLGLLDTLSIRQDKLGWPELFHFKDQNGSSWMPMALLTDGIVAVMILAGIAIVSEGFWRWKFKQPKLRLTMHLTTLLALTIIAGIWMGLNMMPRKTTYRECVDSGLIVFSPAELDFAEGKIVKWGWPFAYKAGFPGVLSNADGGPIKANFLFLDLVVAGAVLWLLWYLCELRIHKASNESKLPESPSDSNPMVG